MVSTSYALGVLAAPRLDAATNPTADKELHYPDEPAWLQHAREVWLPLHTCDAKGHTLESSDRCSRRHDIALAPRPHLVTYFYKGGHWR